VVFLDGIYKTAVIEVLILGIVVWWKRLGLNRGTRRLERCELGQGLELGRVKANEDRRITVHNIVVSWCGDHPMPGSAGNIFVSFLK
jgi:hypothetical protein